jgi:hypothetical protein
MTSERDAAQNPGLSKCDTETSSGAPNNPATLLGTAEQQFKSTRQFGLPPYLKARTPGGVVHNLANNDGFFRANDQFGRIGISARRTNAYKPSWMHDRLRTPAGSQKSTHSLASIS